MNLIDFSLLRVSLLTVQDEHCGCLQYHRRSLHSGSHRSLQMHVTICLHWMFSVEEKNADSEIDPHSNISAILIL